MRDTWAVINVDVGHHSQSPFEHFSRDQWSALASQSPLPLTEDDVEAIASLGDPINLSEINAIYRPLSALLQLYVDGTWRTRAARRSFLHEGSHNTPFVIAVAGSVAVGKSTVARLLRLLLSRWARTPRVDLVATDGFLLPNAELKRRGLLERKGFPESYDRVGLIDFVARIKAGHESVTAPVYSHVTYDIVEGEFVTVNRPDILIVEGLNVLQPARIGPEIPGVALSDYFDFQLYVDADPEDIRAWYVDRFLQLRHTAFSDPRSYFRNYAKLTDRQAHETALRLWNTINMPNLVENIEPTRPRATMVLRKAADHSIQDVYLRKM
ncbi:type I pantothenate kinase [Actinomyces minihominis]|uniref:type I pantothenate kinase n=1 Tax=Actinomyces minihominis TaxID=2002838 RepID=UPI000C07AB31|nr:type I pantothenate kinase [Actinomyces minihominis]